MFLFAILAVIIFSFALELDRNAREETVSGVLWVTIIFAGMLGLGRSMSVEKDKGSLDALLIAPVHRSALFFGKMLANLIFTIMVGLMLMVLLTVLFNKSLLRPDILLILILGTIGFALQEPYWRASALYARARESLLPIMLLPVMLPIVMSAVRASNALLSDLNQEDWLPWLRLLAICDVAFLVTTFCCLITWSKSDARRK